MSAQIVPLPRVNKWRDELLNDFDNQIALYRTKMIQFVHIVAIHRGRLKHVTNKRAIFLNSWGLLVMSNSTSRKQSRP